MCSFSNKTKALLLDFTQLSAAMSCQLSWNNKYKSDAFLNYSRLRLIERRLIEPAAY